MFRFLGTDEISDHETLIYKSWTGNGWELFGVYGGLVELIDDVVTSMNMFPGGVCLRLNRSSEQPKQID